MVVLASVLYDFDFLHSFEINFQTGWSPESDIAFHFNPRIGQFVYMNSSRNGSWEREESASIKPLTKETSFNMFVVIQSVGFEVCFLHLDT